MKPYYNLPVQQRDLQRLLEGFNADEAFWRSLEPQRRLRRKILKRLTRKQHHALDLLGFATKRPPDDGIAQSWFEPWRKA